MIFLFCSGILVFKCGDNLRNGKVFLYYCVLKDVKKENKWLELELVIKF